MSADRFTNEKIKLLYEGLPTSLIINVAAALIVAARFSPTTEPALLFGWLAAMGVVLLARTVMWMQWRHRDEVMDFDARWLRRFRLHVTATGIGWGAAVLLLIPPGSLTHNTVDLGFLCIALIGLSAGAAASLSVDSISALGYRIPMILPLVVLFLAEGSSTASALGMLTILYLAYVTANSARMSRSVHENIRLRIEAGVREQLLQQSEQRLNQAQHVAHLGSFDWDPISGALQWSDEHFRLWGLTPGSTTPDYALFQRGIHPDDLAMVEAALQRALNGTVLYECEHRVVWPDGRVYHIQGRGEMIFDGAGRAVRMLGTVLDITALKQSAEAVTRSLENLQRTLDATGDGIFAYDGRDPSGRLLFANDALFEIWRIPPEDIPRTGRAEIITAARKLFANPDQEVARINHILTLDTPIEDRVRLCDGRVLFRRSMPILGHQGISRVWSFRDITAEERVLELVQTNEAEQRALLDAFPGSIGRLDANLVYSYVNAQLAARLGATAQSVIGQSVRQLMGAAQEAQLRALADRAWAGERVVYENHYPSASAEGTTDQITLATGADPLTGQPVIYLFGIDITATKQSEQALRASEQRFRQFSESSSDWFWETDADMRFSFFSENAERVMGRSDQLLGRSRTEIMAESGLNPPHEIAQHLAQLQARQAFRDFEYKMVNDQDDEVWVAVSGVPHLAADASFMGYRGTAKEITQRKTIERQLADRKAHLEDLVEQRTTELTGALAAAQLADVNLRIAAVAFESHEGMFVTNADSVILRVNSAFTEITGYSAEEAVGQTPRLFKSGRHDTDFYRGMWDSIQRTGKWQGEIWDRRKDGEIYPKWLTISAVSNAEGEITHYIGAHFDITERKRAEEKIRELAFYDQLTGLPNRTLLLDRLKQAMTTSSRSDKYGALLFLDLDHFKTLNDTLGHDMGDLLLQEVAQRLIAGVRTEDSVSRLGGDEFVVVLANLSSSEADAANLTESVGEKILASLAQPFQLNGLPYECTSSIGATLFRGHSYAIEEILKQADLAMYKSKAAGRNTLRFFDPKMETAVLERAALEADLRAALLHQQFIIHYQAQVLTGGRISGAEALVRWNHPERGMMSPNTFIPLAEETGMILQLGQWVLTSACTQLAAWAGQPDTRSLTIAVNVSSRQFHESDFVARVLRTLEETGANPQRLKLELTESLLVANLDEVIDKMFALKGRGVSFSLDDFGTGYSSLSYLKRLPLDQLKIDQSFIRDVIIDPNDAAIARTIITLSQSLGLAVIAEGVETEVQREFLAQAGCHAYQGYLFSRPLPIEGFEQLLPRT